MRRVKAVECLLTCELSLRKTEIKSKFDLSAAWTRKWLSKFPGSQVKVQRAVL